MNPNIPPHGRANAHTFLSTLLEHDCTICDEPFSATHAPVILPTCKHVFGSKCLRMWVLSGNRGHNRCPVCRDVLFDDGLPLVEDENATRAGAGVPPWHDMGRAMSHGVALEDFRQVEAVLRLGNARGDSNAPNLDEYMSTRDGPTPSWYRPPEYVPGGYIVPPGPLAPWQARAYYPGSPGPGTLDYTNYRTPFDSVDIDSEQSRRQERLNRIPDFTAPAEADYRDSNQFSSRSSARDGTPPRFGRGAPPYPLPNLGPRSHSRHQSGNLTRPRSRNVEHPPSGLVPNWSYQSSGVLWRPARIVHGADVPRGWISEQQYRAWDQDAGEGHDEYDGEGVE
ncbi:Nn.00g027710.m01.CDS01 [Neocucurbitaria sp. VM-36]